MLYLGLDCSTKAIHGVWLDEEGYIISQRKWASKDKQFDVRFVEILTKFDEEMSKITLHTIVAVEAPIYIQNPKTTVALAYMVAGVRYICHRLKIPCVQVDNKVWKKVALHHGQADKNYIKQAARTQWPNFQPDEQDFYDAACIALYRKMEDEDGTDISF